jgi:hypothetical protein
MIEKQTKCGVEIHGILLNNRRVYPAVESTRRLGRLGYIEHGYNPAARAVAVREKVRFDEVVI